MNARAVGESQVHYGLSGLMSLALLLGVSLGLLALQPIMLAGLSMIDQVSLGEESPAFLEKILSIAAPALSISAMAAPLLVCYRAVQNGSPNHGLQWHLFGAFGFASALGVVYGVRVNVYPIVYSNACGLFIQLVSLAAVWSLSPSARHYSTLTLERMPLSLGMRQSESMQTTMHWLLYIAACGSAFGGAMIAGFLMPLHKVLGPLFTVTCVLPYVATFSTFSGDILSYRRWERLPLNSSEKREGPKGVDTTTLITMQVNNILWNWYGMLIRDPAVLISSSCSYFAAAIQIIVYLFPVFDLTYRHKLIRLDPAYPFLGTQALLTKGPMTESARHQEVTEKLSAVELMATSTNDGFAFHNSEPPQDHPLSVRFETPTKLSRSEGPANQQAQLYEAPWSLHTTAFPVAAQPDV